MSGEMAKRIQVDDEAVAALTELLEVALELKKTGVLGWLKTLAETGEKLQELAIADAQNFRMLGLLYALQAGLMRVEPGDFAKARRNLEATSECLFAGLSKADPAKAPKPGTLGLLKALGDERVRKGLGILIELARGLGECALEKEKKA